MNSYSIPSNLVKQFEESKDDSTIFVGSDIRVLIMRIAKADEALREVDRLAEAGLCQFSSGGKHVFLDDIRSHIAQQGIQGGLTEHKI